MRVDRHAHIIVFAAICCFGLAACKPEAASYVVRTGDVAAKLFVLNQELNKLHNGAAFSYMQPRDREQMHQLIGEIYDIRATIGRDIDVASAAQLFTFVLDGDQATKLGRLRDSVYSAVSMAGGYRAAMSSSQRSRYDDIREKLIRVETSIDRMHVVIDDSANTRAVVSALELATAVVRARQ
jgi:hypothetical protein